MRRSSRTTLVLSALCLAIGGCTQWVTSRGPAPEASRGAMQRSERNRRPIRVELMSGAVVAVTGAFVRNDSLIGAVPGMRRNEAGLLVRHASPVGYPFADIRRVEYQVVESFSTIAYYVRSVLLAVPVAITFWLAYCTAVHCFG
jgi:hypothetical protein